ncbi:putative peptide transporter ptr2 [Paramyrothecium foliicola]|nr:putative peptide transporter ptr2 [Paramyrothecium foliicola]
MAVQQAADATKILLRVGKRRGLLSALAERNVSPLSESFHRIHLVLSAIGDGEEVNYSSASIFDIDGSDIKPYSALFSKALDLLSDTRDAPTPSVILTLVFSRNEGQVIRCDFLERRFEGCHFVHHAKSFLTPLAEVSALTKKELIEPNFLCQLPKAVGGIISLLSDSHHQQEFLGEIEDELLKRLTFPWLSQEPIRQRRVVWVQGRDNFESIHRAYEAAWALGITLVIVDQAGHWLEDDKGPYAYLREAFITCSIDVDAGLPQRLYDVVKTYPQHVDGLVTISDVRLASVAKASEMLGLPTSPSESYTIAGDKGASRLLEPKAASDFVAVVSGVHELDDLVAKHEGEIPYPLIVKPSLGWNSDCVSKVKNLEEMRNAVKRASERHANAPTKVTKTVIEPYISGPEVDANFVMLDGEILYFQVLDDFPSTGDTLDVAASAEAAAAPNFMETIMLQPSGLPEDELEVLKEGLKESVLRQGFSSGVFHCEARVRNSRTSYRPRKDNGLLDLHIPEEIPATKPACYLHENNARTPGYPGTVSALLAHGVDYYAIRLLFALGDAQQRIRALSVPFAHGSQYTLGLTVFPPTRGGIMETEDAIAEMLENHPYMRDWIVDYQTMRKGGAVVYGPDDTQLWFIGYADLTGAQPTTNELSVMDKQPEPRTTVKSLEEGTANEQQKVPAIDKLPSGVWIVAVAGAAERFAYYCLSAPLQNYIQNPRSGFANPGALNLGQQTATNISNGFLLVQFVAPMPFALLADMRLGRLNTLMISLVNWGHSIYQIGSIILFVTSLPVALDHGAGLPGLIVALFFIGVGVAGVKATLPPFLVDQYSRTESRTLKTKGNKVIVSDRTLTIQFITNMFFWLVNVASLSSLASTFIEKKVDFWASNLMSFLCLLITQICIFIWRNRFVTLEVQGSILPLALQALWCAARNGFKLHRAAPSYQREHHGREVPWDDAIVKDVGRALIISRVLLFSCPFYLAYLQIMNNLISQAGQMRLGDMPNDTMQIFNPVACIILGPVIQRGLFGWLRRRGISFRPIARISMACFIMSVAMAYAAGIQHLIYTRGPCFDRPLACPAAHAQKGAIVGNDVVVWVQMPVWFILATGEILGFATISEIAYEMAPKSMKSLVQAITQVTAGLAAIVGIALSPITKDPSLVILYSVIGGLTAVAALFFWMFFKDLDKKKEESEDETTEDQA